MAIVVLGDIAVDIVSYLRTSLRRGSDAPAEIRVMPGGSGANVAVWIARLGAPVTLAGRVGDDQFGRWLAADLAREGVSQALVIDLERTTAVIQVLVEPDGERTMAPDRGASAHWADGDVEEELIAGAALLHVVGYALFDPGSQAAALQAMAYARAHGVPISLDPSSHGPLSDLGWQAFWSLAGRLSILLPNRSEAQALAGCGELDAVLSKLLTKADVVAIKLDRDGCLAGAGAQRWRQAAPPVTVSNATGAGDAFDAAFLVTWLRERDLSAACRAGVECGSRAAALPGAR
jgi:sugar/nucleoside kinase (ribokinase family)